MQLKNVSFKLEYIYSGLLPIFGLLVYLYYISFQFGIHNDYRALDRLINIDDIKSFYDIFYHVESVHLLVIGRPLNAILFNLQQMTITSIDSFRLWRIFSALTLVSALVIFYDANKRIGLCKLRNRLVFLILFMPASIVYIFWVTNFVPGSLTVCISATAYWLMSRCLIKKTWFYQSSGILVTTICMLIYPPCALSIIIPAGLYCLYGNDLIIIKRIVRYSIIWLASSFIVSFALNKLVFFKLFAMHYGSSFVSYNPSQYNYSIGITPALIANVFSSLMVGLETVFVDNYLLAFLCAAIICVGLFLYSVKIRILSRVHNKTLVWKDSRIRSFFILYAISFAPALVTKSFVAYRLLFAMSALTLFLIIFSLSNLIQFFWIRRRFIRNLVSCSIVGVYIYQFSNLTGLYVKNSVTEYNISKNALINIPQRENILIRIAHEPDGTQFSSQSLLYEMGYTATTHGTPIYSILHFAASDLGISRYKYQIDETQHFCGIKHETDDDGFFEVRICL